MHRTTRHLLHYHLSKWCADVRIDDTLTEDANLAQKITDALDILCNEDTEFSSVTYLESASVILDLSKWFSDFADVRICVQAGTRRIKAEQDEMNEEEE
jgi:hypothetical protein